MAARSSAGGASACSRTSASSSGPRDHRWRPTMTTATNAATSIASTIGDVSNQRSQSAAVTTPPIHRERSLDAHERRVEVGHAHDAGRPLRQPARRAPHDVLAPLDRARRLGVRLAAGAGRVVHEHDVCPLDAAAVRGERAAQRVDGEPREVLRAASVVGPRGRVADAARVQRLVDHAHERRLGVRRADVDRSHRHRLFPAPKSNPADAPRR